MGDDDKAGCGARSGFSPSADVRQRIAESEAESPLVGAWVRLVFAPYECGRIEAVDLETGSVRIASGRWISRRCVSFVTEEQAQLIGELSRIQPRGARNEEALNRVAMAVEAAGGTAQHALDVLERRLKMIEQLFAPLPSAEELDGGSVGR